MLAEPLAAEVLPLDLATRRTRASSTA